MYNSGDPHTSLLEPGVWRSDHYAADHNVMKTRGQIVSAAFVSGSEIKG